MVEERRVEEEEEEKTLSVTGLFLILRTLTTVTSSKTTSQNLMEQFSI